MPWTPILKDRILPVQIGCLLGCFPIVLQYFGGCIGCGQISISHMRSEAPSFASCCGRFIMTCSRHPVFGRKGSKQIGILSSSRHLMIIIPLLQASNTTYVYWYMWEPVATQNSTKCVPDSALKPDVWLEANSKHGGHCAKPPTDVGFCATRLKDPMYP